MTTIDTIMRKRALTVYETRQVQSTYQGLQKTIEDLKMKLTTAWAFLMLAVVVGVVSTWMVYDIWSERSNMYREAYLQNHDTALKLMRGGTPSQLESMNSQIESLNKMIDIKAETIQRRDQTIKKRDEYISLLESKVKAVEAISDLKSTILDSKNRELSHKGRPTTPQRYQGAPTASASVVNQTVSNCYAVRTLTGVVEFGDAGCQPINFKELK